MKKAQVIKMQSYRDYRNGHIRKSEVLEGKTLLSEHKTIADVDFDRELDKAISELFDEVGEHNKRIARAKKDWSKAPHHRHCCCDKCAPTREDLHRKVADFNKEAAERSEKQLNLAPSDCEPD